MYGYPDCPNSLLRCVKLDLKTAFAGYKDCASSMLVLSLTRVADDNTRDRHFWGSGEAGERTGDKGENPGMGNYRKVIGRRAH